MSNSIVLTSQPASTLSVVPNQNTTFSVAASANFNVASYSYQWKKGASNISGATSSTYFFEPSLSDNGSTFTCVVSGLSATSSGNVPQAFVISTGVTLTVTADSGPYAMHVQGPVANANPLKESGKERFLRLRNLGYF